MFKWRGMMLLCATLKTKCNLQRINMSVSSTNTHTCTHTCTHVRACAHTQFPYTHTMGSSGVFWACASLRDFLLGGGGTGSPPPHTHTPHPLKETGSLMINLSAWNWSLRQDTQSLFLVTFNLETMQNANRKLQNKKIYLYARYCITYPWQIILQVHPV